MVLLSPKIVVSMPPAGTVLPAPAKSGAGLRQLPSSGGATWQVPATQCDCSPPMIGQLRPNSPQPPPQPSDPQFQLFLQCGEQCTAVHWAQLAPPTGACEQDLVASRQV